MKKQLILAAICLSTSSAFAQEQKDTTNTNSLNEVIISANKTEETRRTVSQQVQVLTAKEIRNAAAQTTADLISNTAGIFTQRSQMGGGSPVLRGFEASRILLVVDGVRMNNLIYRGGHLQNILSVDNNSLDRVEVLFGPSSTMYGSDALGGVIHMFTMKPLFASSGEKMKLKVNAFTRFGSANDEFTGHADFNIGGQKLASYTSVTFSDFGDLRGGTNQNPFYNGEYGTRPFYVETFSGVDSMVKNDDRYLQVQSAYQQIDIVEKLLYRQSDNTTHGLNIQYSTTNDVPRYDRLTDPNGAELKYAEWYYGPADRMLIAYDFNTKMSGGFFSSMHAGVNYQTIEESRHQRRFGRTGLQHRTEKVNVMGANVDFKHVSEDYKLNVGIDAQYNTLTSTAEQVDIITGEKDKLDTRYPDGDNSMMNVAVYATDSWKINDALTLTDGIRLGYTTLKSTFNDTTFFKFPFREVNQGNFVYSGSIGLIHVANDDLKFTALLSTGFRVPNIDDLSKVFETSQGAIIVPNEDIKPEKTVTGELGITKIYDGKTSWENTLFYTSYYDVIVTDEFKYQGKDSIEYDGVLSQVLASQNKDHAYIYGFTSSYRTRLLEDFVLSLSATYTYGRVKTDSVDVPLDHIPPFYARLGLNYTHKKFSTDFFVNYNSWKKLKDYSGSGEDNLQYATAEGMPAWFTVNMRASYQLHKLIALQVGVDNIFDTQYRVFASGINAPGRNVFGTLRFTF
ncbi:MAG: TonB-dependent receptor [Bacteroidia bacterium]